MADSISLAARAVSFAYDTRDVVSGVSFTAGPGELIGIVGPNGAGKSTLLKLLTGYLRPKAGEVLLNGAPASRMSRRDIARSIAFVPQKTQAAFSFSVLETILMARHPYAGLSNFETEADYAAAQEALASVEMSEFAHKRMDQLSGGEQQLVILARAIAQATPILLLDEPATFLDLAHQYRILTILRDAATQRKIVIATFHDLNLASRCCSRVVLMQEGRIAAEGEPGRVFTEELLGKAYGIPVRVTPMSTGAPRVELPD